MIHIFQLDVHTAVFKMDNQQGPKVQHRELCSILYNNLKREKNGKVIDKYIGITESLCCIPETKTTF